MYLELRDTHDVEFFFFNDTATTEIYTLSLHDALPIFIRSQEATRSAISGSMSARRSTRSTCLDRKSTRLNSSHSQISYAVFCLKKKKTIYKTMHRYQSDRRTCSLLLTRCTISSCFYHV